MRIAATALSPAVMIEARVGFAALFLLLVSRWARQSKLISAHWKHYLIIGFFNSALPFLMFAWAAQTLTASMLSVLNATAPIWGVFIGFILRKNQLTVKTSMGLILGISGVALLVGLDQVSLQEGAPLAIAAGLTAAFSYSIASTYARSSGNIAPFENAHGSMWAATLLIVPLLPFSPAVPPP